MVQSTRSPLQPAISAPVGASVSPLQGSTRSTLTRASNGSLTTATPLGAFPPGKRTIADAVGQGNSTDFMQIEVTANSRVRMLLSNNSRSRMTGALLNAKGAVVASSASQPGQRGEVLVPGVRPGIYYLRVRGAVSGTNRYTVNLFVNRSSGPEPLPCGCGT
jgi:hypothetical protein